MMSALQIAGAAVGAVILFIFLASAFKKPMRAALRLAVNTVVGFILLVLADKYGAQIGIDVGVNWVNAAVVGVFGVPGFALLLLLRWLV